jgi:hypothetical protein
VCRLTAAHTHLHTYTSTHTHSARAKPSSLLVHQALSYCSLLVHEALSYTPTHRHTDTHTHTQRSSEAEQQAPQKNGGTGVTASDGSRARARRALIALVGDRLARYSSSRQQDEALLAGATRSPLRIRYACATHTLRMRYAYVIRVRDNKTRLSSQVRAAVLMLFYFFF